jgi:nicotinate-nucleotide adenylyltransferase
LRLGILGGTFDPIHLGHLRTAEEIGQELRLEKVYLIPSALPPHKTGDPVTPFHQRLAMARLAVSDSPLLEVLDLEGRRTGFSYSIETLKEFHALFSPDPELFFIIGVDAFLEIKSWKEYQNLFDYAHFVIIQRPGFQPEDLKPLLLDLGSEVKETLEPNFITLPSGKTLIFMVPTLMDISSTRVRGMVAEGKSIRFLVPESVMQFIMEKKLYRNYANAR